eukprot:COSAG01_NODE_155_length_23814_cov_12.061343_24_plen_728_part_00
MPLSLALAPDSGRPAAARRGRASSSPPQVVRERDSLEQLSNQLRTAQDQRRLAHADAAGAGAGAGAGVDGSGGDDDQNGSPGTREWWQAKCEDLTGAVQKQQRVVQKLYLRLKEETHRHKLDADQRLREMELESLWVRAPTDSMACTAPRASSPRSGGTPPAAAAAAAAAVAAACARSRASDGLRVCAARGLWLWFVYPDHRRCGPSGRSCLSVCLSVCQRDAAEEERAHLRTERDQLATQLSQQQRELEALRACRRVSCSPFRESPAPPAAAAAAGGGELCPSPSLRARMEAMLGEDGGGRLDTTMNSGTEEAPPLAPPLASTVSYCSSPVPFPDQLLMATTSGSNSSSNNVEAGALAQPPIRHGGGGEDEVDDEEAAGRRASVEELRQSGLVSASPFSDRGGDGGGGGRSMLALGDEDEAEVGVEGFEGRASDDGDSTGDSSALPSSRTSTSSSSSSLLGRGLALSFSSAAAAADRASSGSSQLFDGSPTSLQSSPILFSSTRESSSSGGGGGSRGSSDSSDFRSVSSKEGEEERACQPVTRQQQKALPPPIPNGAGRRQSDAKARAAESFARPPPHPRDRTAEIDYQLRHQGGGRTQDAEEAEAEAEAEEEEEVKPSPIGSRPRRRQLPRGSSGGGGGGGGVQTRRMTRRSAAASRPALSPLTLASPRVNSPQPPPPHSPQPAAAAALACPSSTMRVTRAQAKRFNHSKPDYTPRGGLQSYGDV